MKYINATQMMNDENEAYMNAQGKIKDELTKKVNYVVHTKIQNLLSDAPDEEVIPVKPLQDILNKWLKAPAYNEGERNIIRCTLLEIEILMEGRN